MKFMGKHILLFTLAFTWICRCMAVPVQQDPMDSLRALLQNAKDDTNKVKVLFALSEQCSEEEILDYASPSLELAKKLHFKKGMADASNNVGYAYMYHGDIERALEYYHQSLALREEIHDTNGIAVSLNNLATIYNSQGDVDKALEYYNKGLDLQRKINDKLGMARSLNNIGNVYNNTGNIKKCADYFLQSLALYEEVGDSAGLGYAYTNIGSNYRKQKDLPKALEYLLKGLAIREKTGDKQGLFYSLHNVGWAYYDIEDYVKAREYSSRAIEMARFLKYPAMIGASSQLLSSIDAAMGSYKDAYDLHVLFMQMTDSVKNGETKKAALKKQMQYEFDKKQLAEQAEHEKEKAIAEAQQKRRQLFLLLVLAVAGAVAITGFVIFRSLQSTRKQKVLIELQKEMVEMKQKEVIDSIHYAKRIQNSILPSGSYIEKTFQRLMKNRTASGW